jgi:glycosyltransferase involved in cell wall biosynthesis
MKIALCIQCPLLQHGGVETLVRELIRGLKEDFEIHLVSDDKPEDLLESEFGSFVKGCFQYDSDANASVHTNKMIEWARSCGIELFHFHHGGTYGWKSRRWRSCVITSVAAAGFRCVSTNHGAFSLMDFVGAQRPLWFKLVALCICWPAKLRQIAAVEWEATVSKHDWNAVRRWFFPMRNKFIQIYHSVLDADERFNPNKNNFILCLGTIGARKGQHYLAEAFGMIAKKNPEWRLVIAGRHSDPDTTQKMLDAIKHHGIEDQVDIYKDVPDDQAEDLLSRAAIFAMPSVAEGLGLSLQEAMFHGAACIGSSVGGITDMLEQEHTGLLVPPTDTSALAQGLDQLIKDPLLRERLAAVGRASIPAKGMTKQAMHQRHAQLYKKTRTIN